MKNILSLITFVFLNIAAYCQFNFGVIGGFNGSQVSGDDLGGFNKFGGFGGIYTNIDASDNLNIEMEMVYTQKGSRKQARPNKFDFNSYLLQLNYIEVPLLFNFKVKGLGIEIGPSVATLLSFKEADQNGVFVSTRNFFKTEASFNAGVQYSFNKNLKGVFRFTNSVIPIRKHASGATYRLNLGQYNTVLTIMLKYSFFKEK